MYKFKKNDIFYIILFIVIIIIIFGFINIFYKIYNNKINKNNYINTINTIPKTSLSYYRCENKVLGKVLNNVFKKNNIVKTNEDWDIYIPCGYNNVENELKEIIINNKLKNKYIFGINGCDSIVSKNKIWGSLVKCFGREYASKLMPESYILGDPDEMTIFRNNFKHNGNEIYIMKKNLQRKEGLKLTKNYIEIMGGTADDYRVVQKYITDLYLINDRKVNLRVYLLVVIKDNTIYFYLSDIGKCIYTNKKYNDNNLDFESNITSYHLDMNVYKENPRSFDELRQYINRNGHNSKLLFDNIELLIRDVSKCISNSLYQSKNIKGTITFQLFGGDIIFDTNLHPYLLEFNKGPDMIPRDDLDEIMKNTIQTDLFQVINILPNNKQNSFKLLYKSMI